MMFNKYPYEKESEALKQIVYPKVDGKDDIIKILSNHKLF
jgi:hypothetical protein